MWLEQVTPRLNELWRGEWKAGFVEPARYLYDHELVCVTGGKVAVKLGEEEWKLVAGDFIIIPPGVLHVSWAESGKVSRACLHFDWESRSVHRPSRIWLYYPQKPRDDQILPTPTYVPESARSGRFDRNGEVPGLLETLFHRWRTGGDQARALCRGLFLELLTRLFWPERKGKLADGRRIQLAHAVKELLDRKEDVDEGGIQSLLASLGFSYPHLCRLFHQTFGVTPAGYLNARKLELAKALLRDPRLTVSEAAYAVGFRDAGYFARKFREQNGVTPGAYRSGMGR